VSEIELRNRSFRKGKSHECSFYAWNRLGKNIFSVHGVDAALVATVGNGHDFRNGRQFSVWLGLVPRQYSTAARRDVGIASHEAIRTLGTLLAMGARLVLQRAYRETDPLSPPEKRSPQVAVQVFRAPGKKDERGGGFGLRISDPAL
jgi:Transposase IS116/IS110/IS902 family